MFPKPQLENKVATHILITTAFKKKALLKCVSSWECKGLCGRNLISSVVKQCAHGKRMYVMKKVTILKNTVTNILQIIRLHVCFPLHCRFLKGRPHIYYICICDKMYCCCSVAHSCPTLCHPIDCSMPGFPVIHCLPEFAQTPVH